MISLQQLLGYYPLPLPPLDVSGLKLDSRQVAGGDCFVAVPGYQVDGRDFIEQALVQGASVVLAESDSVGIEARGNGYVIEVPDLKNQLSAIAGRFYQHPSQQLKVIGVTGTNGKTSVTYILAQLLNQLGEQAAVIGTTGSGFPGRLSAETHTTPDPLAVQQRLASLKAEGATVVAMEVSSHALVQRRVEAVTFAAAVATNISRDHLDYHGTMVNYTGAKRRLFTELDSAQSVVNCDDSALAAWLPDRSDSWRYSLRAQTAQHSVWAEEVQYSAQQTQFTLCIRIATDQVERHSVCSPLLGSFNVYNVLAAVTALLSLGYPSADIVAAIRQLEPIPGRMEAFSAAGKPVVIVDYAHTPDALQQVLTATRKHCKGQLWVVFGCGGDRDRGKRPQMGRVAAELADRVIVTDDNPRTEEPAHIVNDILTGMPNRRHVEVQFGRREALQKALQQAASDDVIILAGKGHENYQVIGQQRLPYDERAEVQALLNDQTLEVDL